MPVGQHAVLGEQEGVLSLRIKRDEKIMSVAYKPRGEMVDPWQWQKADAHSDQGCPRAK